MNRIFRFSFVVTILSVATGFCSCASNNGTNSRSTHQVSEGASSDIDQANEKLLQLSDDVRALNSRVEVLRAQVVNLDETSLLDETMPLDDKHRRGAVIEVTSSDIRINGDSVEYSQLPVHISNHRICDGEPMLIASPKADYHKVSWVIEQLYAAGCVQILYDAS